MPNIYSLMSNGQRINSNSYLRNDRDTRDTVTLSDIRMTSIRDFDTAPTAMSSTFMEKGEMIRDTILSSYSKYGSAAGTDPSLQATLDLAMSLVLNKPYEDVSRNHKAYKMVFAGRDMDDKELGRAMVDAWGSDSVANDIAMLQRRKDATNDPEEEARLEEQIQARERDLARLGDYSSVRGWFGDQLVKSSAIAPQVIEGASRSILMALVFAGLSTLITPAGAGTLLSSSVVGGSNMLGYLSTMARTAQGAAQLGAAAGTAQYLAQDVLPREYGSMSRELEQLVDESGRHMDKETRKKAAAIYALASTAIEFMTPEPGFGKLLFGVAPRQMASTSFKSWLLRVGVNMLEGGASESIEEALQDFVGSFTQDIAMNASNRTGQTDFNVQGFLDNLPGYITQAGSTLMDTFVPSMIVGIPGAISSSNLATYLANVQNEKDSLYRIPTDDSVTSATNTQRTSQRSVIVPSILVDTPTRSVREFAASIEQTDENGFGSSEKLEPVKVRFDRSRSRYVPIDEHNENLAKYINVNLKNDATVVEIVNDGSIRISNDDIENAVEISGGVMRNGVDIIFRSNDDVIAFAQSLGDSAVIERGENGSYTAVSFVDEEGNEQIRNIQINPDADIDRIVNAERQRRGFNQQRGISSSQTQGAENLGNAQGSTGRNSTAQNRGTQQSLQTSQDSVEEMSQTISTASRGNISRNESDALARLFAVLPESVRNTIFSRNNGQLVLSEEQYERMTGRRVGNRNRALSWLNRLQMVLTGRSDASSFVHELGHIVLVADPQLVDDVRLAFNLSLESREDREAVMGFVRENRNVLNNISDNRARQLLQGISNLDAKGMFSENQEEFIISMLEAHFRSDIRRSTSDSSLPSRIREVFQKVADAIRNVYGRATGNTQLPQNIQDVFNSFFWNGNTEEVRNQSMREGLEQRNEDIEIKIKKPPVFATHAPGLTPEESAAVGLFSLGASSTQNLPSSDDSVNEIRNQRALGEDAVDQGQKRFRNMDDERFKRSIEKNIFLPDYVVKAKLNSQDETVVETARQELDDRDKFSLLSPAETQALYDTDSADEYVSRMKTEGSLSLSDETQTERVYRKAWAYSHVMTPKEAVNSFKRRFNTLPRLMELKRILGPRRVQARSNQGTIYTRMYVPQNSSIYQRLSRLSTDSTIAEVNEVLSSMDSNPREWLHAYQQAVNSGARIRGELTSDQDIIDSYVDMADSDFDIIKNELRKGSEPYGVSYDTIYGISDEVIVGLSVEEAERQSAEAGNITEENTEQPTSEQVKQLQDSLGIARRAASRALDRAREIESQLDTLKQRHEAQERQMKDTIQVLRKTANRRTAEAENLRERIANIADKSNQLSHDLTQQLREKEKALRQAERDVKSAEKRLQDSRDSFNRRMDDMRSKVQAARREARSQEARANRLNRRLWVYGTRVMDERISRAIRGKLSINSKTHDIAILEEPMYYLYYLMHNGQNRRYSTTVSTESMPDLDWELENLRGGLADGMKQMEADGNAIPVTIDLGHVDAQGRPVVAYSGNLGAYRYNRRNIPERLRSYLQQSTIDEIEVDGQLEWKALTIGAKRDIYRAITSLKEEAAISKSEMTDPVMEERRRLAREAARTVMGADIGEITDEMREVTKRWLQKQDASYNGTPSDTEVWDFISKHPDQYLNSIHPKGLRKKRDSVRLSFYKIQRIAKILDGGKDDGPFQRIFVRAFQESYDKVLQNVDRRTNAFSNELENIIGKRGTKEYSSRMEELRSTTMHFRSNAVSGDGFDSTLMQVMAMYIYSQNINGATKLVSVDGNNLSMEDLARINPQKVLEYLNLEEQLQADPGRDESHPTPFNMLKPDEITSLRNKIINGEIESEVPEWVRQIGDMMIDQLAVETPRLAQAAYQNYNTMLEIQDRYFPLVQASRGSWGELFSSPFKGAVTQVNSGSLKARQKNARYPLSLDPFSSFMSAIREQENLIYMSKPVSDASYLLKFGRLENVVSNRFGEQWSKALNDYVKRIANPENHLTDVEKMMNRILGNAAAAKIGLNLMTGIKQFVSLIPAAADGQLSPLDILRGLSHAVPHRKETAELMDRLAYSTLRSGYNVDISRMQNMDDTTRLGQASQRFIDVSTWLAQQGDQLSKMIVWSAMYDKQLRAGKSETDAAYLASDLVNRTMSVTTPISLSEMQSSRNPFARIMFMFTNDLFQMWNIIFADIPMDFKNRDWGRMFQRFSGVVISAVAMALLAGGWLPDKDDDEPFSIDDFLGDFIENMLGYSVPLAGQLVSEWARGYSQSLITLPSEVIRTGSMVYQDLRGNKEISADQYFDQIIDLLLSGGELVGVPTTGLKRPAQSVYDFDTGEFRMNLAYLFGTRWGEGAPNLLAMIMN